MRGKEEEEDNSGESLRRQKRERDFIAFLLLPLPLSLSPPPPLLPKFLARLKMHFSLLLLRPPSLFRTPPSFEVGLTGRGGMTFTTALSLKYIANLPRPLLWANIIPTDLRPQGRRVLLLLLFSHLSSFRAIASEEIRFERRSYKVD